MRFFAVGGFRPVAVFDRADCDGSYSSHYRHSAIIGVHPDVTEGYSIDVAESRAKGLALVFGALRLRKTKCDTVEQNANGEYALCVEIF